MSVRKSVVVVVLLGALAGLSGACTEANLCADPCKDPVVAPLDNTLALEGAACTVEPGAVIFPYKILFVIDVSGSNRDSDPADNRSKAVQTVIEIYIENRAVSFGVISFSSEAEKLTEGFTRDKSILIPSVIQSLTRDNGGTNYLDTLDLVYKYIEEDALKTPEAERARTRYDIQWLSDGVPDPCVRPEPIVQSTKGLMELRQKFGFFDLKLNTTRLYFQGYPVAGCEDLNPSNYLEPMAQAGEGIFQVLTSGNLAFTIGFSEIYRRFESRQFYVVNESRIVWENNLFADSDQDGIRDVEESGAYDPQMRDANSDGCFDRVDQELLPNVDLCTQFCADAMVGNDPASLLDRDGDSLPDCAEQTLGYHRLSSDSDRDGFSDYLELKLGTNPLDEKTLTQDTDRDGVLDADELRQGTNPNYPEADRFYAFHYAPLVPKASGIPGTSCFEFEVDNIRLVHTKPSETTDEGDNLICMYLVQTSVDDPDQEPTVTRACKKAKYLLKENGDVRDPADGRMTVSAAEFHLLLQGQHDE